MGEMAVDSKEVRDEYESWDKVKSGTGSQHADGTGGKEAERNFAESTIDTHLVAREEDEAEKDVDGRRGNGIQQIGNEKLGALRDPSLVLELSRGPSEHAGGVESEGNQAMEPNLGPPEAEAGPAKAHGERAENGVQVAPAEDEDEKLIEEKLPNGSLPALPPELGPRKKSVVHAENSNEGFLANGDSKGPKIQYFCEPNQNLASDAWKIFFYHMLPFTTIPPVLILACLWWAYLKLGWGALLFYTTLLALLATSTPVYSRRFRDAVSGHFYGLLARYVPSARYVVPEKSFPEDRPYIFACHPHGRMFYSTIIFSQLHPTWRRNILQKGDLFMTAAGMFFHVPLLRSLLYLVGVIPAGKGDIVAKLRQKDHVTILIGGVKEVMLGTEDDLDRLYLKRRKGFCRLAIQENAGVVPVYFFNENQMFRHNSKSFLEFWERVNKYVKVGVPFMRGRFLILPMPFRRPLMIAVGEPLFPGEGESVEDFHERYMRALRELFDKYVAFSPKPDHKLIIQ